MLIDSVRQDTARLFVATAKTVFWECTVVWRSLLRRPAFLALAAPTLALGIGACTVTFALIEDFVLTPPPYREPSRLALVGPGASAIQTTMSPEQYQTLAGLPEFESAGAASFRRLANFRAAGDPILAPMRPVSRLFLETLGLHPVIGRNFTEEEDRLPGEGVAIISHRLWVRQFGRDVNIIGSQIKLEGKSVVVIGVLPAGFHFLEPLDILIPLALPPASTDKGNHLTVVARLARDVSMEVAGRAVNGRIYSRAAELGIKAEDRTVFTAVPLWAGMAAAGRSTTFLFFGFGMCLLALAAANFSNLLSLRSVARRREHAVKRALGAQSFRFFVAPAAEGLLIGVWSVALGLGFVVLTLRAMGSWIPEVWMNSTTEPWLGSRAVKLAVALGTTIPFFSAVMCVRAALRREAAVDLLTGQRAGWTPAFRRTGQALVIAQVALASGLLVIAISFSVQLLRLLDTDLGLRPERVLTLAVAPAQIQYPDAGALRNFARDVVIRLQTSRVSPARAAAAWNPPVGNPFSVPIRLSNGQETQVQYRPITADYFGVLGIPILRGRAFADIDGVSAERVAIVNGVFAARHLQGESVGQHIEFGTKSLHGSMRVIGMAGNTKQTGPGAPSEPILYVPLAQVPDDLVGDMRQFLQLHFFISVASEPNAVMSARRVLREIDPDQVVTGLGSLSSELRKLTADRQLDLNIVGAMTLLAIVVAMGGLYSVVSVSVASRKQDMAVKVAIGAAPKVIALEVLGRAARQVVVGLAIGTTAGVIGSRYMRTIVQGFELAPATVLGGVLGLLFCVGLVACLAPAMRAARVDPTSALREI